MRKSVIEKMSEYIEKKKSEWRDKGYTDVLIAGAIEMAFSQAQRNAGVRVSYDDKITIEEAQEQELPRALENAERWMEHLRESLADGLRWKEEKMKEKYVDEIM